MANISLKSMLEASIDPKLVARSKKTGKLVYFKTLQAKDAAMKAGSHEEPKKDKKAQAKQSAQSANMFKGDYAKDRELPTNDFSDVKGPKPGDIVVPNKGEHKGQKHKVIHVFDDGSMNIQPVGLKAKDIKYRQGAVKAKPEDIELPK